MCPFQAITGVLGLSLVMSLAPPVTSPKISCHVTPAWEALQSKVAKNCWPLDCLQAPWIVVRVRAASKDFLASEEMDAGCKVGPNSFFLLTALDPGQGTSPLNPSHLSQAVVMATVSTRGAGREAAMTQVARWVVCGRCLAHAKNLVSTVGADRDSYGKDRGRAGNSRPPAAESHMEPQSSRVIMPASSLELAG